MQDDERCTTTWLGRFIVLDVYQSDDAAEDARRRSRCCGERSKGGIKVVQAMRRRGGPVYRT